MSDIITRFVDYLFDKASLITSDLNDRADMCLKDYMAVTAAGAEKNRSHWEQCVSYISDGSAELIGYSQRTDGKTAALINGFNAHSLELDDGQRFAMIHLGASVISAIKAASDEHHISSELIRKGIIIGYEAACRIAIAMQPSHKKRGYHTAGTCGTIGSAIGAAFALNMSREQVIRVLSCAAGSAAGMLEMQEQRSEIKPYNTGRAAMDGLAAAYMGYTDFAVPDDMIGGERGFFRTFADEYDVNKLTEPADYYEIERIYVKPYASCRHSHSAVEAAVRLSEDTDISQIREVIVKTYRLGVKGHDHTEICGVASAKLSTPYAVAAGLLYGRADLTVFEPLDDRIVELAKRVKVIEDPELTAECPQKRVAIVSVMMNDGTEKSCRIDYAKGDPENPMTAEDIEDKERMLKEYAAKFNTGGAT